VSPRAGLDIFESGIRTPDHPVPCLVTIPTTLPRQLAKCQQPILIFFIVQFVSSHKFRTHISMHFTLSFKAMYLNACGRSARPKRVAYIDETNKTLPCF
jgi:hypothetical protein